MSGISCSRSTDTPYEVGAAQEVSWAETLSFEIRLGKTKNVVLPLSRSSSYPRKWAVTRLGPIPPSTNMENPVALVLYIDISSI